jgi:hypothetical protein
MCVLDWCFKVEERIMGYGFDKGYISRKMEGTGTGARGVRFLEDEKIYIAYLYTTTCCREIGRFDNITDAAELVEKEAERLFSPIGFYLKPDLIGAPPAERKPKAAKAPKPAKESTRKKRAPKAFKRHKPGPSTTVLIKLVLDIAKRNANPAVTVEELRNEVRDRNPELLHNFARILWGAKVHGYLEKVDNDTNFVRYINEAEAHRRWEELIAQNAQETPLRKQNLI